MRNFPARGTAVGALTWGNVSHVAKVTPNGRAAPVPQLRARCMHPDCRCKVTYGEGQGRPRMFCSDRHADAYRGERSRLLHELAAVHQRVGEEPPQSRRRRDLNAEGARLRWLLVRYPPLTA